MTRPLFQLADKTVFQHESWLSIAPRENAIQESLAKTEERRAYPKQKQKFLSIKHLTVSTSLVGGRLRRQKKGHGVAPCNFSMTQSILPQCFMAQAVMHW